MAQFLTFLFIIIAVVWVVRRFAEQSKPTRSGRKPHRKSLHESSDAAQRSKLHEPKHASRPTGPAAISERSHSSRETARRDDPAGHWVDVLRVGEADSTEEAVRQLAALGPQAYPELRRALRDPTPFVRTHAQRAVEAIAAEQRRQATQPIPLGAPRAPEAEEPQATSERPPEPAPPPLRRVVAPPGQTRAPIPVPEPRPDLSPPDEASDEASDEAAEEAAEEGREAAAGAAIEDAVDVAALLAKARGAVSFGGERDEILAPLAGGARRFTVVVEEVARTTAFDASPAYRGGSTIHAHLPDTEVAVAVRVPPDDHLEAGAPLERGRAIVVAATFRAWDNLYDRGVFEGTIVG